MINQNWKYMLPAWVAAALWGTLFPCIKIGYAAFEIDGGRIPQILMFAGARFVVSGLLIAIAALLRKERTSCCTPKAIPPILASGFFTVILHYSLLYIGLSYTDSAKASILGKCGALLYVCFSFLLVKEEKFQISKIIGAGLGFSGIIVINVTGGVVAFEGGDILIILASLCLVAGDLSSKAAMKYTSAVTTTGLSQLFGGLLLVILSFVFGGEPLQFTWKALPIFVYICAASIVAYCLWNYSIRKTLLPQSTIIKFSSPVFSCIFGAIFLGENIFKWQYLLSFFLIIPGTVIGNVSTTRKKEQSSQ